MPLSEYGPRGSLADSFEDLYDNAPCGYLSLGPDGRIAHANQRIAAWTGRTTTELVGRRLHDVLSVPARIFYETNVSPMLRLKGQVDEIAMDFLTTDGAKVQSLVNAAERRDAAGKLMFTRLTVFRATERRRYERALVDANVASEEAVAAERESSRLREQFIAVLGHDLRNPLASLSSGIRLLARREQPTTQEQKVLLLMQGSVNRASELVENVLDFARGRLGGGITLSRGSTVPLGPVLEQVAAEIMQLAPARAFDLDIDLPAPIDCDHVRLGQLFSNLLGNAVAHGAKAEPILVRARATGDTFRLTVTNGGAPIDARTMERLFQPFFRGDLRPNRAGLGLGLHIASEIAKAHGGSLTVDSVAHETSFTFAMPLVPTAPDTA